MKVTDLEEMVLRASRKTDYGDALVDPVWSFSVFDHLRIRGWTPKMFGGVVSSLIKKGLVVVYLYEKGNKDKVFALTDKGKEILIGLYPAQSENDTSG